ncbi:HAMP domain-containing sensor histidine kinase [Candidatus Mycobacterium wuenschmannii]|uniref:histidine kinase n=1 Tax=Candidatus Mycobacterium wuenschmannii TaxID=3027808 RepID=A0ABY8W2I7_9MYCO|nr:HAMP domain-containing sensor histidine kinase [Candidatus Mycobacterium wuenschmannii]WIM90108.1 HAMP domain-containing sensor histidine kinase [Candidatus Mycobacterium wuenschmannii]
MDVSLNVQARRSLHDRLMAVTSRADVLVAAHTPPSQIAAELNGGGIRARLITADGTAFGDRTISPDTAPGPATPLAPPPPPPPPHRGPFGWDPPPPPPPPHGPPPPPPDSTAVAMIHPLPDGGRVILVADTTQTTQVTHQLRQVMIGAGAVTLAIATILLMAASRVALRPLERLTALASAITTGDRGRRLRPDRRDTELGRAATAFDGMLDELENSERRAQNAAEIAQQAETATRRFLVDAAHELRTPIAGIQVAAEQLVNSAGQHDADPIARGQYRRASLLLSDARRAGRLVADMLDLGRIDAGLPLHTQDIDLAAVVDAEYERAAMLSSQLTISRSGASTITVQADPTRVAQILSNLFDNARRHTPPGGRITIDLEASSTIPFAVVTITDSGHGVPEGERDRIFQRLVRLDDARARDHGGAGLGLPIARALARAHGGDLCCIPHQGGARFQLTLPVKASAVTVE